MVIKWLLAYSNQNGDITTLDVCQLVSFPVSDFPLLLDSKIVCKQSLVDKIKHFPDIQRKNAFFGVC